MKNVYIESSSNEDDTSFPQILRLHLRLLDGSGTQVDRPAQLEFNFVPPSLFLKTNSSVSPDVVADAGFVIVDVFFQAFAQWLADFAVYSSQHDKIENDCRGFEIISI